MSLIQIQATFTPRWYEQVLFKVLQVDQAMFYHRLVVGTWPQVDCFIQAFSSSLDFRKVSMFASTHGSDFFIQSHTCHVTILLTPSD